ncbi:MAG: hypothetical protein ACRCWM_07785 [Sarcina sp.]|uniref:hypothetical protein n=1 Tax=Clostridium sp. TaxID=1506 RepID=UPI003F3DCD86
MAKYVREFVEYSGISDRIPEDIDAFKNISIDGTFKLSPKKPGIESFLKCSVKSTLFNSRLINGAFGVGADGKKLTGVRCAVEGEVCCRVEYIGKNSKDLIYTDRVTIPCVTNVPLTDEYMYSNKVIPTIFLDDIYLEKLNCREYLIAISGIVTIED